jgi:hypothetical protein
MTTNKKMPRFGLLGTLAPELARELGEAFSVDRIGARSLDVKRREPAIAGHIAGRLAAFFLVAALTVTLTMAGLYLMQLP